MAGEAKRVLLYRLGSLGDHLVALPSYRLVARSFPEAERRLLTNKPVAAKAAAAEAVLGDSGLVHGFFQYRVGERSPRALLRLAWRLRRWKPDVVVYLAPPRGVKAALRDARFFRLCGVRRIVGLPDTDALPKSRFLGERGGVPWWEHEGERLLRCVAELGDGGVDDPANWSPELTEGERREAEGLLRGMAGFFAVSLGTKAQSNEWGEERWAALLQRLAAAWQGCGLVMLGAEEEREASERLLAVWGRVAGARAGMNLCGVTRPRVSAAVLERAVLFLGHDSGPAHLAASVRTPVVGVFSARMPAGQWVPHGDHVRVVMHWVECGGCLLQSCVVQGKKCIYSISVDEVFAAVAEHVQVMVARGIREPPSELPERELPERELPKRVEGV